MYGENLTLYLQIGAFCMLFFYSVHLFFFLRKILKSSSKNNLYVYAFSLVNVFCAFFYQYILTNYLLLFFFIFLLIFIESLILSRNNYRQALFGAAVVVLHIVLVYLPTPIVLCRFFDVTPLDMVTVPEYRYITIITIFSILHFLLYMVKYVIKAENFILVSTAKIYSEIFIFVIFFMAAYLAIDCMLLISDSVYTGQLELVLVTSFFTTVAFYSILIYTIDIVNFAQHKRQSDLAEADYNNVLSKKKEIVRKNTTDDLTGLYNRKFIYKSLNELCLSSGKNFAILYIDVNGLKYVNDTYGHEEGDIFLKNVAIAVRKAIREDDYPARIGGDEFIVLVNNITESDVSHVIKRIKTNLDYFDQLEKYPVSASIGFLYVKEDMYKKGYKALLEKVDDTMRREKAAFYKKQNEEIFLKRGEI